MLLGQEDFGWRNQPTGDVLGAQSRENLAAGSSANKEKKNHTGFRRRRFLI